MKTRKKAVLAAIVAILVVVIGLSAFFSVNLLTAHTDDKSYSLARVACLGDSITQLTGYPADLQTLLGNNSTVGNYGVTGATVIFNSDVPYFYEPAYHKARVFQPTTAIVMLGTNDAHESDFKQINTFAADYKRIITGLQVLYSSPQIFIVIPPPVFNNTLGINGTDYAQAVIPLIEEVASQLNLPVINLYTPLLNHPEYFPDGVHPDSAGAQEIANIIYKAIKPDST